MSDLIISDSNKGSQTNADGEKKPKKKKKDKVLKDKLVYAGKGKNAEKNEGKKQKAKLICDNDILTELPPDHKLKGEDLQPQGIVGGEAAVKNQFKYQASLLKNNIHVCGGALLDARFMITAAHCVYDAEKRKFISGHFTVILTAIDLYYIEYGVIKDSVKRVFLLAAFTYVTTDSDGSGGYEADLALVKLKGRLKLDGNLYQETLQICNFNEDLRFDKNLIVSGYGYTKIIYTRDSETLEHKKIGHSKRDLRYADVDMLPDSVCMNFHQYYKPYKHLCARVRQRSISVAEGTCHGDDGNPLVYEGSILVGVLSANSSGCYERQEPAVYTNVAYYAEFVKNVLQRKLTPDMLTATWRRKSIFHTTYKLMEGIQTHADGEKVAVKKKKDINLVGLNLKPEAIVGGEEAAKHQFNYQVSLLKDNVHVCGGALLDSRFFSIAAHCVFNIQKGKFISGHFTVIITAVSLHRIDDAVKKDSVKRVFLLLEFAYNSTESDESGGYVADLALGKLNGRLKLDEYPFRQALQVRESNDDINFERSLMIVGYGYTRLNYTRDPATMDYMTVGYSDRKLRFAEVDVVADALCMNFHSYYQPGKHLCAKVRQRFVTLAEGTCYGDDGSPLVYDGYILVGVLSAPSSGCYERQEPAVYTNVAYYYKFIDNVLQRKITSDMRVGSWRRKSIFHFTYKLREEKQIHKESEVTSAEKKLQRSKSKIRV